MKDRTMEEVWTSIDESLFDLCRKLDKCQTKREITKLLRQHKKKIAPLLEEQQKLQKESHVSKME